MLAATEAKEETSAHQKAFKNYCSTIKLCVQQSSVGNTVFANCASMNEPHLHSALQADSTKFIQETDHVLLNYSSEMVLVRKDMIYHNSSDFEMCDPDTGSEPYASC